MFYVALRILLYDKVRSLITLLGVVFAVGLIFNQLGIFLGLMETSSVIVDHTPGDIWVTSKNSKNFDFSQPFPDYVYHQTISDAGIQSAEKLIVAWGIIRQKEGGTEQVEVVGFNPDSGVGGPWELVSGDLKHLKNGNYAIVDESAMKRLGRIQVGEYRDVLSHRLQIVGISRGAKSFTTAPILFTSFELAQRLVTYVGSDSTVFVVAKVKPGVSVKDVVTRLKARFKGVDVFVADDFSMKTRRYWAVETGVGFSFLLTIIISFLVGMLIVGQTIYNSTMEHIKEFGTLKALGATNREIYKIIFSQAMINALAGYIVSLIITLASVKIYEAGGMVMVVRGWVNFLVLGLTLLMCFASAFVSVRRIKRIDPAILFRG
ncbi:FtsX-like permease family protein [Geobacter argillaceus]|uniref:Putative ABC transport system permease protein n=1 Tax=Geobacter argillaceus TaxID=345631 RepID=A0A562VHP1_9BACT|nr:FtsX-like permease family protein [Geobacter argillaceus]TWJ17341.1 putative ABC transport system permease protein [Geobacter argillaceus]